MTSDLRNFCQKCNCKCSLLRDMSFKMQRTTAVPSKTFLVVLLKIHQKTHVYCDEH